MNRTMHEIEPEEVMAYLDGELEPARAGEIAAHIATCGECTAVAADLRALSEKLATWPVEAPTITADAILQAKAAHVPKPAYKSGRVINIVRRVWASSLTWRVATVAAVLILILAVGTPNLLKVGPVVRGRLAQEHISNYFDPRTDSNGGNYSVSVDNAEVNRREAADLSENLERDDTGSPKPQPAAAPVSSGPMIARTAAMKLVVAKLDPARALLEKLLARHHGFASAMTLDKSNDATASLDATLQVPSSELDATLGELRGLGRVTTESQQGEDVSDQHVDLAARLHNEREAEQRLIEILRTRTGKLSDVVEVEEQISQTRGEIEQMEAQLANLDKRVSYASIKLQIAEEYKAPAATGNGSVGLRLRNAVVGGYRDAVESLIGLVAFFLNAGPMMLLWGFILFWPARAIWKRRGSLRTAFGKS